MKDTVLQKVPDDHRVHAVLQMHLLTGQEMLSCASVKAL